MAASRSFSSPGSIPSRRNRFCREVAPEIKLTRLGLQPKAFARSVWIASLAFPFSGGAVTATRRAPARSPRIALRLAPG